MFYNFLKVQPPILSIELRYRHPIIRNGSFSLHKRARFKSRPEIILGPISIRQPKQIRKGQIILVVSVVLHLFLELKIFR